MKKSSLQGSNATEAIHFLSSFIVFYRHCEAVAIATTKQSKIKIWIATNRYAILAMTIGVDCHDFASQNLAMTNLSQIHESLRVSRNDKSAHFVFARRCKRRSKPKNKTKE